MKTPDFKRKTVKKTHEPEKHTSVDKKKRKTTYEKEKHSHEEDNSTSCESESDYWK